MLLYKLPASFGKIFKNLYKTQDNLTIKYLNNFFHHNIPYHTREDPIEKSSLKASTYYRTSASYSAVCLEGAIIVLACIIFSLFAATPPAVNPDAAAVSMVWSYIGELVFNMLVLVGAVKMADRVVREMMGL